MTCFFAKKKRIALRKKIIIIVARAKKWGVHVKIRGLREKLIRVRKFLSILEP